MGGTLDNSGIEDKSGTSNGENVASDMSVRRESSYDVQNPVDATNMVGGSTSAGIPPWNAYGWPNVDFDADVTKGDCWDGRPA